MIIASMGPRRNVGREAIRRWAIWSLPRHALAFVLTVDALAIGLTVVALVTASPTRSDLSRFILLAALSAMYSEVEDRTDRFRRYRAPGRTFIDAQSVWTFAAVLVLPAGYAALLISLIYAHTAVRAHRHGSWRPHRVAFTGAAVILSALAAGALYHLVAGAAGGPRGLAPALGVLCALAVYRLVNDVAVATVIYLATRPAPFTAGLVRPDELIVEIATMILGAFTAQTIIQMPWLTPTVLVLIVMMYRGLLARKLEVEATTDGKTGLLNATAWRDLAQRHLWRAVREDQAAALLVIDLDRFKALNDEHGHLVGDLALKAVADSIKHELRDYDAVGRYGGEEFVALLPNAGANHGMRAAQRVRERIEACSVLIDDGPSVRLTASTGVATYPTHGAELDDLIRAADTALYAAKAAGRNAVRLAEAPSPASATSHESQSTPA